MPSILQTRGVGFVTSFLTYPGVEPNMTPEKALKHSLGSVLIGSFIAIFMSGVVSTQAILYYQVYPRDRRALKGLVALIWFLDTMHSMLAIIANWEYLIEHFGDRTAIDLITWSIAVTVAITAMITFIVHCFFSHRIHTLSRGNWYVTVPLICLAFVRLIAALVSTSEMVTLKSYIAFVEGYHYVFTLGLSSAASLDILISTGLCYYLRRGRTGFTSMDRIIDSITLYTVECGVLTCIATLASLICWLTMSNNLIFLGLHFGISKLYSNSFLATLNARKSILNRSHGSADRGDHAMPVLFPDSFRSGIHFQQWTSRSVDPGTRLHVKVEKTVQRERDPPPAAVQKSAIAEESEGEGSLDVMKVSRDDASPTTGHTL